MTRNRHAVGGALATLALLALPSLALAQGQAPQIKTPPSKEATPIEIPGKATPKAKLPPPKEATPIEIPGKAKPQVKKVPSKEATPIEIPGKAAPHK